MMGLLYIIFFAIYLLVSVVIITISYRYTKRHYQRGRVGGCLAAFAMYNLVFWDWIPTIIMHQYYCSTDAGFWVNKTPEEWIKENPEVWGQDWSDQRTWKIKNMDSSFGNTIRKFWISDFIYYLRKGDRFIFDIEMTRSVNYAKTGENNIEEYTASYRAAWT